MTPQNKLTWDLFFEYKKCLDDYGQKLFKGAVQLGAKINTAEHYRFILLIIFGSEYIKEQLKALNLLDDYIAQLHKFLDNGGSYKVQRLKANKYESITLGAMADRFYEKYSLENTDPLRKKIKELVDKRNNVIHEIILTHLGDLDKINDEIKSSGLPVSINEIGFALTTKFNLTQEIQEKLSKAVMSVLR